MSLDPLLLDILACPIDKGPLLWFEDEDVLYNPRLRKSYAVTDGVPVLLVDEAADVGDAEHERLSAKAERGQRARHRSRRGVSAGSRPRHVGRLGRGGLAARTARRGARLEPGERGHRVAGPLRHPLRGGRRARRGGHGL